ncbi:hypothetical protein GCM10009528_14140 [Kineococcus aurantiacus]
MNTRSTAGSFTCRARRTWPEDRPGRPADRCRVGDVPGVPDVEDRVVPLTTDHSR